MTDTWITPRIWVTGERVGQSKMNEISNNFRVLYPYTAADQVAYSTDTDELAAISIYSLQAPTGAVVSFAGSSAPTGWLICNGAAISRSTYAALFAILGTTFGAGDGSTTFSLPDLRGRVPVGAGAGSGLTNRVLGATGGEENHTLTTDEMPAHTHPIGFIPLEGTGGSTGTRAYPGSANTGSTGGDDPHNNMQPFIVLNTIIKT